MDFKDDERRRRDKGRKEKKDKGYNLFREDATEGNDDWATPTVAEKGWAQKADKSKTFRLIKPKSREKEERNIDKGLHRVRKDPFREKSKLAVDGEEAREKEPLFGIPLNQAALRSVCHDGIPIPLIFRLFVDHVEEHGLDCVGIYKVAGVKSRVEKLRERIDKGKAVRMSDYEPHVIASLLKLYLRELPEPILSSAISEQLDRVAESNRTDERTLIENSRAAIGQMPRTDRLVLAWIIMHMQHVIMNSAKNRMGLRSVVQVLSPILQLSHRVLSVLLRFADVIFEDVNFQRYRPPLPPAATHELQRVMEDRNLLAVEIEKQQSLLEWLHPRFRAFHSKELEEQIWDVQRLLTQMKRKMKVLERDGATGVVGAGMGSVPRKATDSSAAARSGSETISHPASAQSEGSTLDDETNQPSVPQEKGGSTRSSLTTAPSAAPDNVSTASSESKRASIAVDAAFNAEQKKLKAELRDVLEILKHRSASNPTQPSPSLTSAGGAKKERSSGSGGAIVLSNAHVKPAPAAIDTPPPPAPPSVPAAAAPGVAAPRTVRRRAPSVDSVEGSRVTHALPPAHHARNISLDMKPIKHPAFSSQPPQHHSGLGHRPSIHEGLTDGSLHSPLTESKFAHSAGGQSLQQARLQSGLRIQGKGGDGRRLTKGDSFDAKGDRAAAARPSEVVVEASGGKDLSQDESSLEGSSVRGSMSHRRTKSYDMAASYSLRAAAAISPPSVPPPHAQERVELPVPEQADGGGEECSVRTEPGNETSASAVEPKIETSEDEDTSLSSPVDPIQKLAADLELVLHEARLRFILEEKATLGVELRQKIANERREIERLKSQRDEARRRLPSALRIGRQLQQFPLPIKTDDEEGESSPAEDTDESERLAEVVNRMDRERQIAARKKKELLRKINEERELCVRTKVEIKIAKLDAQLRDSNEQTAAALKLLRDKKLVNPSFATAAPMLHAIQLV